MPMPMPKCEICDDDFSSEDGDHSPRNLKCSHTLCEGCIKKLLTNRKVLCPFCREPTEVPENNIKSLHKNFSLIQMIQLLTKTKEEAEAIVIPKCKAHSYNLAEFICVEPDCSSNDKLMCRTCEDFGVHKGHAKDLLITKIETSRKSLQNAIHGLQNQVRNIDKNVDDVKKSQTSFLESGDAFQTKANQITTFYSKLREKVNEREEEALSELKEVAQTAWVTRERSLPSLLESRKTINRFISEANELMKINKATSFCEVEALLEKTNKLLRIYSTYYQKHLFLTFWATRKEIRSEKKSSVKFISFSEYVEKTRNSFHENFGA